MDQEKAAARYMVAHKKLEDRHGFHFIKHFDGHSTYTLTGSAVIGKVVGAMATGVSRQEGEWRVFHETELTTRNYRRDETGLWKAMPDDTIVHGMRAIMRATRQIALHRLRRAIEWHRSEIIEGEECDFFTSSWDSGWIYDIWISSETHRFTRINVLFGGRESIVFRYPNAPVQIEEPVVG